MIFSIIDLEQISRHPSPSNTVILPFNQSIRQRKVHGKPCIFCGLKLKTRNFKGKAVCLTCLKTIPFIFNCS